MVKLQFLGILTFPRQQLRSLRENERAIQGCSVFWCLVFQAKSSQVVSFLEIARNCLAMAEVNMVSITNDSLELGSVINQESCCFFFFFKLQQLFRKHKTLLSFLKQNYWRWKITYCLGFVWRKSYMVSVQAGSCSQIASKLAHLGKKKKSKFIPQPQGKWHLKMITAALHQVFKKEREAGAHVCLQVMHSWLETLALDFRCGGAALCICSDVFPF